MGFEPTDLETDIQRLEVGIRQLKIQYDMFFSGAVRRPPYQLQNDIERLIRHYTTKPSRRLAQRFHFDGLATRYCQLMVLWNKQLRSIEEDGRSAIPAMPPRRATTANGASSRSPFPAMVTASAEASTTDEGAEAAATAGAPEPPAPRPAEKVAPKAPMVGGPVVVFEDRVCDPGADRERLRAIYEHYVRVSPQGDEGRRPSFDAFSRRMSDIVEDIKTRFGCQGVDCKVVVDNGKARLRARPA